MFETIFVSSLLRVGPNLPAPAKAISSISVLRGERVSVQAAFRSSGRIDDPLHFECSGSIKQYARIRRVRNVAAEYLGGATTRPDAAEAGYERLEPGFVPDVLDTDLEYVHATPGLWHSLWIDFDIPANCEPGEYSFSIAFAGEDVPPASLIVNIGKGVLPAQTLKHTEWFHCDGLFANYGKTFDDEEFWPILKNYFLDFTAHGMNMVLTPLFTPPLDTEIGAERLTTQLLKIRKTQSGWNFDFTKAERWVKLARECGITYFEFPHFFTQWGAKATPKIVAEVNGREEKVFGWHVASDAPEYREFLNTLLPEVKKFAERLDIAEECCFHISDEPTEQTMDTYRIASELVKHHLKGYRVMDALSHADFFRKGLVSIPVPIESELDEFIKLDLPERWTYYCLCPELPYPNRIFSMPLSCCRILGTLLYVYQCAGFLHWGFNFWNSAKSRHRCDLLSSEPGWDFPAGDSCLVYPGTDGPLDSIREEVQYHGLEDMRALQLLESLAGRDFVMNLLRAEAGMELKMSSYPRDPEFLPRMRLRVNAEIEARY